MAHASANSLKRRYITGLADTQDSIVGLTTDRGYTEHEMLDELGIIHMNGRIYDPLIGRFMSADPFIQAPDNLQSFNRYSYVLNNPLRYIDPTGFNSMEGNGFGWGDGGFIGDYENSFSEGSFGELGLVGTITVTVNDPTYGGTTVAVNTEIGNFGTFQVQGWTPEAFQIGQHTMTLGAMIDNGYLTPDSKWGLLANNSVQTGSSGGNNEMANQAASFAANMTPGVSIAMSIHDIYYGYDYFTKAPVSLGLGILGFGLSLFDLKAPLVGVKAAVTELSAAQLKNIERFMGKVPANAKESLTVRSLPNDGVAAQAVSPGRVPGSYAVYEKQIDATGDTIQYTKTTYDPEGNIVHVKDKISNGIFP